MATVNLSGVLISNVANPAVVVQAQTLSVVDTPTVNGAVRSYANGRQRLVTTAAKPRSVQMSFTLMPAVDVATLTSWAGQVVLVRDPFGLKMFGAFFAVPRTQQIAPNVNDVAITFQEVTVSEAT